jgi:hypothetical protein
VAQVAVDHQKALVAHARGGVKLAGGVHGGVLANETVLADDDAGGCHAHLELVVLGRKTDARAGIENGAGPDDSRAFDEDVGDQFDIITQRDIAADDAAGADLDVSAQLCGGINGSGGVNETFGRGGHAKSVGENHALATCPPRGGYLTSSMTGTCTSRPTIAIAAAMRAATVC